MKIVIKLYQSIKWVFLVACMTFISWVAMHAGLNYAGYCSEKGRILSEDEMIRMAVQDTINWMKVSSRGKKKHLLYKDVDDFLARNPDCCSFGVYARGTEGYEPFPTLFDQITGSFRGYSTLNYTEQKLFQDSEQIKKTVHVSLPMNNCGKISR